MNFGSLIYHIDLKGIRQTSSEDASHDGQTVHPSDFPEPNMPYHAYCMTLSLYAP
jgi:hypothetical protein